MSKVLFLDIDGVLNTELNFIKQLLQLNYNTDNFYWGCRTRFLHVIIVDLS